MEKTYDLELDVSSVMTEELKKEMIEVTKTYYWQMSGETKLEMHKLAKEGKYEQAKLVAMELKKEIESSVIKDDEYGKNLVLELEIAAGKVEPNIFANGGAAYLMSSGIAQTTQYGSIDFKNNAEVMNSIMQEYLNDLK